MAITTYASRGYNNGYQIGGVLSNPVGITTYASRGRSEEEDKNRGGLIGGIGYLGEKLAVGTVSSIEGISDYTFSGLAKLFGNDAWAEDIIKNDWFGDWYSHPEEWFNPDQGWQVAGDVASGIGSSLPAMGAAVGLTLATGGLAAPAAASFLVSGLGAAGRATKEAYEQTGKLTGKEYGYGALVGATEGGVEALGNLLSLGSGAVVKSVSKAIGKETAEAFAKQGILKTLGESFVGEAFEEGFSEFITPYWQRATYDPKAKNASADEILYASLVGGLSGVVMGGGGYVIDNVTSFSKGNKLTISGGDAQVLATAGDFASFEELNQTGDELFSDIANKRKSLLESLQKTNGKAVTIQQKRDLGALERANIAGSMKLFVATRAQNIINNAPLIAERLTAFGYKTADGKPIRFTAEEITAGYDPGKPSTIYKALQTNSKLRELAVADATGRLMMDTNQFKKNALMGEKLASQVDINRFYEQASREELQAVTDALKIESWSELTPEIFNQKITDFINDGGVERTLEAKERKAAFAALTQEGAQNVPKFVNLGKDSMRRYTDGQLDIAVERKGDKYTLYNYKTDNLSKEMKREDINKFFRDYSNQKEEYLAAERERLEVEQKRRAEFEGIETMLRDNVSEYKTLNAPNQSMIRRLVREGRAKGVSDSDLLMYAKVSAHSGIDIQFDKEANYRGVKNDGSADYADGFYEASKNRIVVNPEGKRTAEKLLIHELDHAIRKYFDSEGKPATRIYLDAIEGVDQATRDRITEAYKKTAKPGEVAATVMDETNAYYAEQVLGNKYTLEKLIEAEPTLKDKILSFFKGASTDYADVPKLSGAAKKYYRTYKKLFDDFSARNAQSNANEKTLTSMNQENMQVSDRQYAFAGINADTADKMKLATAEQMLKEGKDSETVRRETGWFKGYDGKWRFEIDDSELKVATNGKYSRNPMIKRYAELVDKVYFDFTASTEEQSELKELDQKLKDVSLEPKYLGDMIEHPQLFAAYPQLQGVKIAFIRGIDTNKASYHPGFNEIAISQSLRLQPEKLKNVLIHEIQHAIQEIEGLAGGSNVEMFNDTAEKTAFEQYYNTAGEIEARDAANRLKMSEEQRKNTRPDIDRTDVVFADKAEKSFSYIGDTKDGRRCYTSGFDKNLSMDDRIELFKTRIATIFNLGAVELKTDVKKIRIRGDRFTAQKNLFGDKQGDPGEYEAKINSLYDLADILATATYDPTATNREPSYNNPNVKPKNAAHKNVKYWYKFRNKIVFDGVPYEVTFNIRDKGKDQYQYLIDFKEDKTPGLSNTAVNNLLRADQASYMSSISQPTQKSNTSTKKSSKKSSGKDFALDIDSEGENISGAEVMGWLNKKPKNDGTLNLEETVARGLPYKRGKSSLTVGEIRKVIANTTHEKVYSKSDALKAVNKLSGTWGLTVKARDEIADTVWQFLNEAPDIEYRQDMAHDIAEYIVAKVLMDSKTENPDALEAAERLAHLRTGVGKLSFSDADIAELRHAVDEKGLKRLMGRWGFKGTKKAEGTSGGYVASRRIPMDIFVTSVAREMPGMEHLEEMHPAEAFLEIDKAYSRAYADSKDKWISSYWDMPDSEIPSMVKDVENGIMSAFEFMGEKSKFKKLLDERIERYEKRAERFKAERDEIKGRDRILGLLMNQASKMKNLKMGTYANATQHDSDVLRGSVERLARIQFRGNLNVSGTRQIISELRLWYNPNNSMLEYVDEQNPGYYSRGISDMLDALADGEGGFDKTDLMMLYDVMAYFTNFVENYGKVWRKGQWVDADVEAKRYVNTLQSNSELKVSVVNKLIGSRYMQTFGDPMTVARRMDMHESGFFTEMLEELREGAMGAQVAEMEILSDYDKFLTENRKYIEKTATERILYQGVEVPKMHLIGVYMTLKRKHSRPGLAQNGFAFFDTDEKKVRVNGFALDVKDITEAEIDKRSEEQIALIDSKLTDTDRQYIKILEKAYNEDARRLKAERDIQRLGFTNAGMGYYYPIRRGNIAKNVDSSEYMAELDRVSNSSFNKNTVKGARQELYIENADVVFRRHIKAVTKYSYLSPAIEAYNKLYNLDVGGNPNQPISVATESANTWGKGNEYFKKLIADIQGIPAVSGEGAEILSKIRGGYAKYQLGANPKVWFTQLSSLFASTSRLDPDSIVKAAGVSAEGLDKYCPLAKLRNSENTAAIAQAVLDTRAKRAASGVSRISDALMAPIGKMDRFVVGRLFAACQVQVEKDGGAKVGTEQNKIAAGELLTQVILETQQNSIATERSAAMRSGNEIVRTMTMFTSDSMKVTGRVIDAYGESLTLKARIKAESDATKRAALEKRLEAANKKVKKSLGAMVGSAVYMACVAQLFRWLYNKEEDEDKTVFETMFFDTLGNMLGGLPLIKDVYTKLFEGYDISNYSYSAINDLIDSAGGVFDLASKAISGDLTAEVRNREIRNLAYSVGQLTGMPTRNVYNVLYGLTKRFSPTTAFVVDSWFYEKNYQNELNKAIEKGDNKTASYILSVIMGERFDEDIDEQVFSEILSLTASGYKVLPKLMPESITLGDVEYPLSDGEREAMQKIYSGAEDAMKAFITSKYYGSMTDDEKAIAIDYISDLYYDKARNEVLGIEADKGVKLLRAISAEKLAAYYVKTRGMQSDVDDNGNTISGSKREKVVKAIGGLGVSVEERLLLICASGYALKDGDVRGLSADGAKRRLLKYILNLRGLSADERAEIAVMCGFEVRNGKIINNFSKKLKKISKK